MRHTQPRTARSAFFLFETLYSSSSSCFERERERREREGREDRYWGMRKGLSSKLLHRQGLEIEQRDRR